jgi:small redox-active disulfide protein 2
MTDIPSSRSLKIGTAIVGLVGLDLAMTAVLAEKLPEDEAVDRLFRGVAEQNYIPATATASYREALRLEYRQRAGLEAGVNFGLTIRILGPGCVTCNRIKTMVIEVLQKLQLAADMEQINDLDEIWRHGVINTPALVINGQIKSSGRHPSPTEVEEWIREAAAASST